MPEEKTSPPAIFLKQIERAIDIDTISNMGYHESLFVSGFIKKPQKEWLCTIESIPFLA